MKTVQIWMVKWKNLESERVNQSDTVQDKAAGEGAGEEKTIVVFACKSSKSKITQCLRLKSFFFPSYFV